MPLEGHAQIRVRIWDEDSSYVGSCVFLGEFVLDFQDGEPSTDYHSYVVRRNMFCTTCVGDGPRRHQGARLKGGGAGICQPVTEGINESLGGGVNLNEFYPHGRHPTVIILTA